VVTVTAIDLAWLATVALFGLAIGSFVNVVVARVPEHRSLLRPGSSCPGCGAAIAWHDNIPVLSFVLLRGRCRACGIAIAWRYPFVEIGTAALWVAAYVTWGLTIDFGIALVFLTALVAVTAIDLERQIIPDVITLPGILAGFVANVTFGRLGWVESGLGILVGGGLFLVIILASGGGMGGGDMKLGAMFGAFLGWKITLVALFLGVVLGGGFAIALLASGRMRRKDPIPFGPFLAAGGAISLFWGERVMRWYLTGFAD
jgi:leader peptidase (prepilin peptidase) / N-methyltransferase